MTTEEWRPVLGFEGLYEVSNLGRVWGARRNKMLTQDPGSGYYRVRFHLASGPVRKSVHQLVAEAFHGPRPVGLITRHLDGNPLNNTASNLAWGTYSENNRDTVRHGHNRYASQTHCKRGHPFDEANTYVYANGRGWRTCRACGALGKRRSRSRVVAS